MRMIDADALEELFREVIGGIAKKPEMNGNLEHMVRASAMVIEMIKDAPTIEPKQADDLISRADAIDAVSKVDDYGDGIGFEVRSHCLVELEMLPSAQPKQGEWIPCEERLPEDIEPVIVTWKNNDSKSYYQYIVGKHFIGTAHYKSGKWYWYSSVTEDFLAEYGRCDSEEFDEAIEVIAWMPLPQPYSGARMSERSE